MTAPKNPPKGYRWVRVGEKLRPTDELSNGQAWKATACPGHKNNFAYCYRRIRTTKKGRKKK